MAIGRELPKWGAAAAIFDRPIPSVFKGDHRVIVFC